MVHGAIQSNMNVEMEPIKQEDEEMRRRQEKNAKSYNNVVHPATPSYIYYNQPIGVDPLMGTGMSNSGASPPYKPKYHPPASPATATGPTYTSTTTRRVFFWEISFFYCADSSCGEIVGKIIVMIFCWPVALVSLIIKFIVIACEILCSCSCTQLSECCSWSCTKLGTCCQWICLLVTGFFQLVSRCCQWTFGIGESGCRMCQPCCAGILNGVSSACSYLSKGIVFVCTPICKCSGSLFENIWKGIMFGCRGLASCLGGLCSHLGKCTGGICTTVCGFLEQICKVSCEFLGGCCSQLCTNLGSCCSNSCEFVSVCCGFIGRCCSSSLESCLIPCCKASVSCLEGFFVPICGVLKDCCTNIGSCASGLCSGIGQCLECVCGCVGSLLK